MKNKKKIVLLCGILIWELLVLIVVYGIGGVAAPWFWNISIFLTGVSAFVAGGVQTVILVIRLWKKKTIRWNLIFLAVTAVLAYPATVLFGNHSLIYPEHSTDQPVVTLQRPVEDGIMMGGAEFWTHAVWPSERYAYDILKKPCEIHSKELTDYGIYLADVAAPADGTVIAVKDTEEDILPGTDQFQSGSGNYIYLRLKETGTYLILAHLEKDSIRVAVGDEVKTGDLLARVGNSGTTSEPHLHIQHQKNNPVTMKYSFCAQGLPILFE